MYKNKEQSNQAAKLRMQKLRGVTKGVTSEGVTGQGVTEYPAHIRAMLDPDKRRKVEAIYQSLHSRKWGNETLADRVTYGWDGPTYTDIGVMLELTKGL